MKYILSLILFPLLFLTIQSCGGPVRGNTPAESVEQETKTPRQTIRQAMRASVWRFVYCVEEGTDETDLLNLLHEIAGKQPFGKRIEVVRCDEISPDSLGAGPLALFGNRLPAGAEGLPVGKSDATWRLAPDKTFTGQDVLLMPYYRNPWGNQPTISGFFLSDDLDELVGRLEIEYGTQPDRMFWPNWAYELHRANGDLVYGSFADTSWNFDPEAELTMTAPSDPVSEEGNLRIFAYDGAVDQAEVEKVKTGLELIRLLTNTILEEERTSYPEIRLYPNLERIGLRTGNMDPVQFNPEEKVLHIVPSFVTVEDLRLSLVAWRPFLGELGGTDNWERVVALAQRQAGPRLNGYDRRITEALRLQAAGLAEMKTQEDPSRFLEEARLRLRVANVSVSKGSALIGDLRALAGGADFSTLPSSTVTAPAGSPPKKTSSPTNILAGMTFAHEGYRIHNGYGGEKIKPSMDSLGKLHVNALAIVPYTFMRDPTKPSTLFIPDNAGSENDWATMCSAREAGQRGWFTLLKPQIWLGGGHWPGSVDFDTPEKWDAFFRNYTYWIMHYAVLAEREQINALCLGTELVKTTLKHPDRWREIISKVRQVYGGQLTYAANWGEEFEGFTFWEDLDAIGLNSYYPLSEKEEPTDEELLDGARRWMNMAAEVSRKTKRPLWLTEVGFRSVDKAWVNPHADGGDRSASAETQARCFEALTIASGETPELRGMFIWKWPSYLGRENWRGGGTEFSPGGKPAAEVLRTFNAGWGKR